MNVSESQIAFETVTSLGFDEAVARCRAELAKAGFGVLTEIDLAAKLEEKLGVEIPPNLILGACHPPSAYRSVSAVPAVTVLLPCNVAIAVEERGTVVRAMNPEAVMELLADPVIDEIAREIADRLRGVVATLAV